jgi:transcriptional regulator with XRE-family HTH domain
METVTIGAKFKRLRDLLGLTRPKFSEEFGISVEGLKNIEFDRQANGPGFKVLSTLARHPIAGRYVLWLLTDSLQHLGSEDSMDPLEPIDIKGPRAPMDKGLMIAIIEGVEESLDKGSRVLSPEKKAELIYVIYAHAIKIAEQNDDNRPVNLESISMLVDYATAS